VILEGIMHVVGVRASKDDIPATTISGYAGDLLF